MEADAYQAELLFSQKYSQYSTMLYRLCLLYTSKLNGSIDYEDAYYAGTSLKFNGNMDAGKANHIKLYSAQLEIKEDSKLSVTYKTPDNQGVKMSVGL